MRMVFSALVDADFLDTEAHFRRHAAALPAGGRRAGRPVRPAACRLPGWRRPVSGRRDAAGGVFPGGSGGSRASRHVPAAGADRLGQDAGRGRFCPAPCPGSPAAPGDRGGAVHLDHRAERGYVPPAARPERGTAGGPRAPQRSGTRRPGRRRGGPLVAQARLGELGRAVRGDHHGAVVPVAVRSPPGRDAETAPAGPLGDRAGRGAGAAGSTAAADPGCAAHADRMFRDDRAAGLGYPAAVLEARAVPRAARDRRDRRPCPFCAPASAGSAGNGS